MSRTAVFSKSHIKRILPVIIVAVIAIFLVISGDESRLPVYTLGDHMKQKAGDDDNGAAIITDNDGFAGIFLEGPSYLLDSGTYYINLTYAATHGGSSIAIMDNGRPIAAYELDPSSTEISCPFTLMHGSERLSYVVSFSGVGGLRIERGELAPEGRFYNDSYFMSVLIALSSLIICIYLFFNNGEYSDGIVPAILILTAFAAFLPYWNKGLPWAIDLCYHLSRIEGIKDGIAAGAFPVIIYPQALFGNGYLGAMYPSLFLYPAAFLRLLGVSVADSFKSVVLCFNLLTAVLTYYSLRQLETGEGKRCSRQAALMAAIVYTLLPYRLTNLYARGAVGEFLAMTFFPLVIAGLYQLIRGNMKKWPLLTFGMCGLVYSHLLSAAVAGLICLVICIAFIKPLIYEKRYIRLLMAAGLSAVFCAAFLFPFAYYYKNGNLWMEALNSGGDFVNTALNPAGLFSQSFAGDYHVLTLGISVGICLVMALVGLMEGTASVFTAIVGGLGVLFGIMTTSLFPARQLEQSFPIVEAFTSKLQFAWRLLGPAAVLIIIAGAAALSGSRLLHTHRSVIVVGLCIVSLFSVVRFNDEDFANRDDRSYSNGHAAKLTGIPRGENTIVYPFEWRPEGTSDDSLSTNIVLSDDTVEALLHYRSATTSTFVYTDIEAGEGGSFAELPVIYYPGYSAVDENGKSVPLGPGTGNRIRIALESDGYEHTLTVGFKAPLICRTGYFITVFGIAASAIAYVIIKKKQDNKVNH